MGRSRRPIPKGLGEKLLFLRLSLNFTQKQMLERLRSVIDKDLDPVTLYPGHISEYERGVREPPLRVLLEYARAAQVPMEVLVDRWLPFPNSFRLSLKAYLERDRKAAAAWRDQEAINSKKKKNKVKAKPNSKPKRRQPK